MQNERSLLRNLCSAAASNKERAFGEVKKGIQLPQGADCRPRPVPHPQLLQLTEGGWAAPAVAGAR